MAIKSLTKYFLSVLAFWGAVCFTLNGRSLHFFEGSDSLKRGPARIGIFLPLSGGPDSRREMALEFYKGMILANEMCTALDSGLELHVFDHRNKAEELRRISSEGCLDGLDLLVGPVRNSLIPVFDSLGASKKIPVMNVLTQSQYPAASDWFHSQEAGTAAISETGFSLMKELVPGPKAGIIFGTEKTDSILAAAYRRICIASGKQVVLYRKVGKNSAANLSKYLSEAGLDSVSHLFVAGNEEMVRVQLLSAYGVLMGKFPVLIHGKWLESPNADLDEYSTLPFYFINADFPFPEPDFRKKAESSFIARWGNPPGWISWKGIDLVMMLSRLWYTNESPGLDLKAGTYSPVFGQYLFMEGKSENQFAPVFRVGESGILRIRP